MGVFASAASPPNEKKQPSPTQDGQKGAAIFLRCQMLHVTPLTRLFVSWQRCTGAKHDRAFRRSTHTLRPHLFPDHASRTSHTEGPAARRTHAGGGSSTYLRCAGQALSQSAVGLRGEARTTKQEPPFSQWRLTKQTMRNDRHQCILHVVYSQGRSLFVLYLWRGEGRD